MSWNAKNTELKKKSIPKKNDPEEAWTFLDGFQRFLKFCEMKNLRSKTMKNYQENYGRFATYIVECTSYNYINELTQYDVDNYVLYLKGFNMRDTSVNTYLIGFRTVLNFWIDQHQCMRLKVRLCKVDKQAKETYSDEELYRLLRKPNILKCDFATFRNWTIVNFFLATGVRVSTLINIKTEDVDFNYDRILLSHTKNRKSVTIPMSGQLKHVLEEYIKYRKGNSGDYLFCNIYGDQMTQTAINHAIAGFNRSRGVNRSGLHAFRHTFAKKCVMNGVNVFVLQRLMGHQDITVTKEYVELYADDLALNIEKYNPLDTLGQSRDTRIKAQKVPTKKKIAMRR